MPFGNNCQTGVSASFMSYHWTAGLSGYHQDSYTASSIDTQLATQWIASSLNLLAKVFGESSIHYQKFDEYCKHIEWSYINKALEVVLKLMGSPEQEQKIGQIGWEYR